MDNKKNDSYYAKKAIDDILAISKYINGKSYDEFVSNSLLTDAIMFRLIQMVENIKNISENYKREHPEIHWGEIMGFRNGIVHEYGKTDYTIVYEIITQNLEDLKEALETLM
jgi:uncharacterized protein with HEPN domain